MRELERGAKYPYHGKPPTDWAERAALGVLYDLNDRRGIKHALADVDDGVRADIVETLAKIIRAAHPFAPAEVDASIYRMISEMERAKDAGGGAWDSAIECCIGIVRGDGPEGKRDG